MPKSSDKLSNDRAEGRCARVSVNPSAIILSDNFSPLLNPPKPFDIADLRVHAKARGFIDGDTEQADFLLQRISYQHASEYFHLFEDSDGAIKNGSMLELHRTILFDREFQSLLMKYIGIFELAFRAQYSYRFSMERGSFAHRNIKNFKNKDHFKKFLKRYGDELGRQMKKKNKGLMKAYQQYGDVPTWMAVEIMSFGTLSMLYRNTRSAKVRESVAKFFGVNSEVLVSWTRAISSARNQCAHFGKLCGQNLTSRPKKIEKVDIDNGNPFYIVLILEKLLTSKRIFLDDQSLSQILFLINDFASLFSKYQKEASRCKIPTNWKKLMLCTEVTGFDFSELDETVQEGDISEFCVVLKEEGTGREAFLHSDGRVTFQNSVKSNASI